MENIRERSWPALILTPITVSGDKLLVEDTRGLHPKQQVLLSNGSLEPLNLEIKRVIDLHAFQVGPSSKMGDDPASKRRGGIHDLFSVPAGYNGGTMVVQGQSRTSISSEAIFPAVYAEEPTVALRTTIVDYWGENIGPTNPLPVSKPSYDKRYDQGNNIIYEGEARPGSATSDPVWRISRLVKQPLGGGAGDYVREFAGNGEFDHKWDDRASLFPPIPEIQFYDRAWEKLMPILANANWMKLGNFEKVVPSFAGDTATLAYLEDGSAIGRAHVRYVHELDWDITLDRYINNMDGEPLLDDDGELLFLD